MSDASAPNGRPPIGRLLLLGLIVAVGLGLFFAFGRSTPTIVTPVGVEESH